MSNVIELAKQAGLCLANDEKPLIERFAALVRNSALEEAAQKCIASELIDMPTRHEIATVRKCAKAIESLKEPTP